MPAVTFVILYSSHPLYTGFILILPTLKGWNPELRLSVPEIEPGPPAHVSEHASERLTTLPTELAGQTGSLPLVHLNCEFISILSFLKIYEIVGFINEVS